MTPIEQLNNIINTQPGTCWAYVLTRSAEYARCVIRKNQASLDLWFVGWTLVKDPDNPKRKKRVRSLEYEVIPMSDVTKCDPYQAERSDCVEVPNYNQTQ